MSVLIHSMLTLHMQASSHNDSGDYESARKFGNAALCCNGGVFIYYILLILAGVAVIIVYFTVGFSWLVGTAGAVAGAVSTTTNCYNHYDSDGYSYTYQHQCITVR